MTQPKQNSAVSFTRAQKTRKWEINKAAAKNWQNDHLCTQSHWQSWLIQSLAALIFTVRAEIRGSTVPQPTTTLGHTLGQRCVSNDSLAGWTWCYKELWFVLVWQEMKVQINSSHRAYEEIIIFSCKIKSIRTPLPAGRCNFVSHVLCFLCTCFMVSPTWF